MLQGSAAHTKSKWICMVPQLHSRICNVMVRIRIRNPNPHPDPEHCSFRYGTYRRVRVAGSGSVSGSAWVRINLSCWIRIRIQIADPDPDPGGQKWPTKIEKSTEFSCFEVLDCSLWRAEGFFCGLAVLYEGQGISKLQFLIKKIKIKISSCKFFQILGHQTCIRIRDPDPKLEKILYPDPH